MREAIETANGSPGPDTIRFNIPGAAPHTINLFAPLPVINEALTIEANTADPFAAREIELNGADAGEDEDGLHITANDCVIRGLCINRFQGYGIVVELGGRNRIQGNFIGTDPSGRIARPNGQAAIALSDSAGNLVGGPIAAARNVLSGNLTGLFLVGAGSFDNTVAGNFIGTDITGTDRLANSRNGILVFGAPGNRIGGTEPTARNVISGNGQSGVYLIGADSIENTVLGNYIGLNATGRLAVSNKVDGVTIFSAAGNTVGGIEPGARNVISGNGERGILINGPGASENQVQGNFIGTDPAGQAALGNGFSGVGIVDVPGNTIGGDTPEARNVISGNNQSGIAIRGAGASNNVVLGNLIGTDATGLSAVSNKFNGITLSGAPGNRLGGAHSTNVISGNAQKGISITEAGASGNSIEGNLVGIDITGQRALGNGQNGIYIEAAGNFIGRPGGKPNIVSGNLLSGITVSGGAATSNRIEGNFVGTDLSGRIAVANIGGILISRASGNIIGSTNTGGGNLISGNRESGIYLSGPGCSNNVVQANTIGATPDGKTATPNTGDGVSLYSANNNIVGGDTAAAGNLISGNEFAGIFITHPDASKNKIQRNMIGTQRDGISPLGNRVHGIEIDDFASGNLIGGSSPELGNRIAFSEASGASGVRVNSGTANTIRFNSIFSNKGLGIDLGGPGVTANDANDADDGANHLLNFPTITAADSGLRTFVSGSVQGAANANLTIDFYISDQPDESGYGEGATPLATISVKTDNKGMATFSATLPTPLLGGKSLAATGTDTLGNTSEFSLAKTIGRTDSDGDGMPDDFEISYNFDPFNKDGAGDADQDGLTNVQEFLAGTHPRDPGSTLRLKGNQNSAGQAVLTFGSVLNRRYRIENTDGLAGPWKTVKEITGTGGTIQVADPSTKPGNRFYRVLVLP